MPASNFATISPRSPPPPSHATPVPNASSPVADSTDDPVVAYLSKRSPDPYSSIALSPCRQYAVTACKDTLTILQIRPSGIKALKSIPMAQHFTTTSTVAGSSPVIGGGGGAGSSSRAGRMHHETDSIRDSFVLDAFGLGRNSSNSGGRGGGSSGSAASSPHHHMINVVITDVAWSSATDTSIKSDDDHHGGSALSSSDITGSDHGTHNQTSSAMMSASNSKKSNKAKPKNEPTTSLIAAAGSNGVIVVWNAASLLEGISGAAAAGTTRVSHTAGPEAVLSQHVRAVNRLAWHPKRLGLLLSASQDGTVLLWERRHASPEETSSTAAAASAKNAYQPPSLRLLFGGMGSSHAAAAAPRRTYTWNCRSRFEPKSEAVRDIRWSPFYEDVFALVTSSGSLVVYNMYVPPRAIVKMTAHSGDATTLDWHPTEPDIVATGGASDRSVKIWDLESYLSFLSNMNKDDSYLAANANTATSVATESSSDSTQVRSFTPPSNNNTLNNLSVTRQKSSSNPKAMLHVLAVMASVTRLRWRPPAFESFPLESEDRHGAMLAVATAPVKGASAGGAGMLALWSYQRPFMPLSVVQGHKDGAVTDFDWLDTQVRDTNHDLPSRTGSPPRLGSDILRGGARSRGQNLMADSSEQHRSNSSRLSGGLPHDGDWAPVDTNELDDLDKPVGIWQHVLSVGRDGRCLIQSFARGNRPISRVPPSCFAMANLSPFQRGYGSLQVFSVCQPVPSNPDSEFLLTGLRRDSVTSAAAGVFCEVPLPAEKGREAKHPSLLTRSLVQTRFPASPPDLVFNVIDQGDLDPKSNPIEHREGAITVAPEVVHLSRFAEQYVLYPNDQYTTRVALCLHNAAVSENLMCANLAHMWRMIASMLESTEMDELPTGSGPANVMQFVILPTIKSLLVERAEDGDVQTCVALCEVLQVLKPDQTVSVPGLEISLVREWYLSYIDLLRDMCLFSHATFLIRSCNDPFIAALNQQSTTIHESCPRCGKPLPSTDGTEANEGGTARRICRSCRRRVGLCFLCHEPVRGMYVWCPGCGHGGHLDHALQWFGGLGGKAVRVICPTGCGHKCNNLQQLISFPRTESLKEFAVVDGWQV